MYQAIRALVYTVRKLKYPVLGLTAKSTAFMIESGLPWHYCTFMGCV